MGITDDGGGNIVQEAADIVNAVTPPINLSFVSTRGSGWDHSTQKIILLHHDRWNWGGFAEWARVSPLVRGIKVGRGTLI